MGLKVIISTSSLINWPNIPKPGFYAVRDACRPFLASAEIIKFRWKENEEFTSDIWLLNDLPEEVEASIVNVKLRAGKDEALIGILSHWRPIKTSLDQQYVQTFPHGKRIDFD